MKRVRTITLMAAVLLAAACSGSGQGDIIPDKPVFQDIGEGAPDGEDVVTYDYRSTTCLTTSGKEVAFEGYPNPREKKSGIFYFIWHGNTANNFSSYQFDITELEKAAGVTGYDGRYSISWMTNGTWYYWGRPFLNYYRSDDPWVIRKHAQQLVAAGIDAIFLDLTNGYAYKSVIKAICDTYLQMRSEGNPTPQIAPVLYTRPESVLNELTSLYTSHKYDELWYHLDGKPLLLSPKGTGYPDWTSSCTFRICWFDSKINNAWWGDGTDAWTWGDYSPQKEVKEEMSVMAASHPMYYIGRSYTGDWGVGYEPSPTTSTIFEGRYFNHQFERALECDPDMIFVTGWNEWETQKLHDGNAPYFTDNYNHEYSRDIEPLSDDFTDTYYYFLYDNLRRFKGAIPVTPAETDASIEIDGFFKDWAEVKVRYSDFSGDTGHRNSTTVAGRSVTNDTGRNDFKYLKVANDRENLYLYVSCNENISRNDGQKWMRLFLDIKGSDSPSWEGFQWMLDNRTGASTSTSLLQCEGDWKWTPVSVIPVKVANKQMELAIPLDILGITDPSLFELDFKWVDNAIASGDIRDCMIDGDSAPDSRFRYRYIRKKRIYLEEF